MNEEDRRRYASVAASFGDVEALGRYGSGAAELRCPECDAAGRRYGNPGDDVRFEGFEPLTRGGLRFILCRCDACGEEVTLPHRRV